MNDLLIRIQCRKEVLMEFRIHHRQACMASSKYFENFVSPMFKSPPLEDGPDSDSEDSGTEYVLPICEVATFDFDLNLAMAVADVILSMDDQSPRFIQTFGTNLSGILQHCYHVVDASDYIGCNLETFERVANIMLDSINNSHRLTAMLVLLFSRPGASFAKRSRYKNLFSHMYEKALLLMFMDQSPQGLEACQQIIDLLPDDTIIWVISELSRANKSTDEDIRREIPSAALVYMMTMFLKRKNYANSDDVEVHNIVQSCIQMSRVRGIPRNFREFLEKMPCVNSVLRATPNLSDLVYEFDAQFSIPRPITVDAANDVTLDDATNGVKWVISLKSSRGCYIATIGYDAMFEDVPELDSLVIYYCLDPYEDVKRLRVHARSSAILKAWFPGNKITLTKFNTS